MPIQAGWPVWRPDQAGEGRWVADRVRVTANASSVGLWTMEAMMYVIRRVYKVKPRTAREAATIAARSAVSA